MRILIVNDDMSTRLLLTRFLTNWGHEVLTASDGVEALEILEREGIQLVVSDWLMPRMDGLELCQRIRAGTFPGYVYVIILTAKDSKGELITAMEAGADDYIAKPFDKNELNVRIRVGERVLNLEKDLEDRNERLTKAFSIMRKDLEAAAVRELNRRFPAEDENMQYFTMICGILDARDGKVTFTQAGQPAPIHMTRGTFPRLVGGGGLPVGLFPHATYDEYELVLQPGERFILYSDGITDCTDRNGQPFSAERLIRVLEKWRDLPLRSLMERVEESLREWRGIDELEDDMSLLAIERAGA